MARDLGIAVALRINYVDEIAAWIREEIPATLLPDGDTTELFRLYALLALTMGQSVTVEAVHDAWCTWIAKRNPDHPSLVPFDQLEDSARESDLPFAEAIRAACRKRLRSKTGSIDRILLQHGNPQSESDKAVLVELYKMMVESSESLVNRRQAVNTFFLTVNGAILTATGLLIRFEGDLRLKALGVAVVALTGAILSAAWRSLIRSFGQLNTGKFKVINRLESLLPVAIYSAEWEALDRGENSKVYRSFTSREIWAPNILVVRYFLVIVGALLVAGGIWKP
jgi:hypothetical protein